MFVHFIKFSSTVLNGENQNETNTNKQDETTTPSNVDSTPPNHTETEEQKELPEFNNIKTNQRYIYLCRYI